MDSLSLSLSCEPYSQGLFSYQIPVSYTWVVWCEGSSLSLLLKNSFSHNITTCNTRRPLNTNELRRILARPVLPQMKSSKPSIAHDAHVSPGSHVRVGLVMLCAYMCAHMSVTRPIHQNTFRSEGRECQNSKREKEVECGMKPGCTRAVRQTALRDDAACNRQEDSNVQSRIDQQVNDGKASMRVCFPHASPLQSSLACSACANSNHLCVGLEVGDS